MTECDVRLLIDKQEMNGPHSVVATLNGRIQIRAAHGRNHEKILFVDGEFVIHGAIYFYIWSLYTFHI